MKHLTTSLSFVLLLCLNGLAFAAPKTTTAIALQDIVSRAKIRLDDSVQEVNLARIMQIHAHADTPHELEDVFSPQERSRFEWLNDEALNSGFETAPIFGYFLLDNRASHTDWYLRMHYALLDSIDLYQLDNIGNQAQPLTHIVKLGDSVPFASRDTKVPSFVQRLSVPKNALTLVVLRIHTEGARYSDIYLHNANSLAEIEASRGLGLGLYFGVLFVLAFYNLLLFFYFRSAQYLVFFGFVITITTNFLTEAGLVAQYLVPTQPDHANLIFLVSLSGANLMGFWLLFVFLFRSMGPITKGLLRTLMAISALNIFASFFLTYALCARVGLGLSVLFVMVSVGLSALSWYRGYTPARMFTLSTVVFAIGCSLESLRVLGALPINDFLRFGPPIAMALFIVLMSLALTERINLVRRRSAALMRSFEKFAPTALVKALHKNSEVVTLGGSRKNVSVVFSDIRGYSSVIESVEPREVMSLMTEYFDFMQRVIEEHGGYILEFTGDGILAVFGAPSDLQQHAEAATRCSIDMLRAVDALNEKYLETGQIELFKNVGLEKLAIRIGVHSGDVIAGTLGSRQTLKYGIIGDTVNVASRLEQLNKELGSNLLISRDTFSELSTDSQPIFDGIGKFPLKGRKEPMGIFRLVEDSLAGLEGSLNLKSIESLGSWSPMEENS